jgi:PTH1 family peptidyl-tRNA hydrolase
MIYTEDIMKLILALGNIGKAYEHTRHNIGFAAVEHIAHDLNVEWQEKNKFKALTTEVSIADNTVILAKPTTLYNQIGTSYRALVDFYKLDSRDILIIHDELALPFGTVRLREGGSDAGNNGIKSILQYGGGDEPRIRIGISNDQRTVITDAKFVLSKFSHNELERLPIILQTASTVCQQFVRGEFEPTSIMHN